MGKLPIKKIYELFPHCRFAVYTLDQPSLTDCCKSEGQSRLAAACVESASFTVPTLKMLPGEQASNVHTSTYLRRKAHAKTLRGELAWWSLCMLEQQGMSKHKGCAKAAGQWPSDYMGVGTDILKSTAGNTTFTCRQRQRQRSLLLIPPHSEKSEGPDQVDQEIHFNTHLNSKTFH